ncbi:MAG: DEAD/DEAH box helicase [Alphaproteobacteria bacterium]
MSAPILRDYQSDVILKAREVIAAGKCRVLIVAATGAGKTIVASDIIRTANERDNGVLFLAHRRELIEQASQKLHATGIDHGIIKAGMPLRLDQPTQVASVQTLWSRAYRGSAIEKPDAKLIVVDEAHRASARTYRRIIEDYPDAVVIGLTATPCRGDGRGLGDDFDAIVECPSVAGLIDTGFLVPTRVFAPTMPDLSDVKSRAGDYIADQLAKVMDTTKITGDIIEHWHKLAERRKTVVFASSVGHSVRIRDEFRRSGVMAEHIDGNTPEDERADILKRLSTGAVEVVCNCMVLTEGWDQPDVSCVVLARPTKHMGLYRQMVGRVLRPAEGKADALVLDHAGCTFRHGFVEDPVQWTLAPDQRPDNPAQRARSEGSPSDRLARCPECSHIRKAGDPCRSCGWKPRPRAQDVEVIDGELGLLDRKHTVKADQIDAAGRRQWYAELLYVAAEKGRKRGWAAHTYKIKFGAWPIKPDPIPQQAGDVVRSYVRSRDIAFAKGREKARKAA